MADAVKLDFSTYQPLAGTPPPVAESNDTAPEDKTPAIDRWLAPTQHKPIHSVGDAVREVGTGLSNIGAAGLRTLTHPEQLVTGAIEGSIPGMAYSGVRDAIKHVRGEPNATDEAASHPVQNALQQGENLVGTAGALGAPEAATDAAGAIRTAAIGNPDAAALRGLRVPSSSPKSLKTINAVQGARPYLGGASSLEDLQSRIPGSKTEIWSPYEKAIDTIGEKRISGPNGPTTVKALEEERQQVSALNRGLKQQNPEAVQLAAQKGMNQAQLLDYEKSIQQSLDPHLQETGINPAEIRKTFGQVARVGNTISGKSTLAEKEQPYGIGKMLDIRLAEPKTWLGNPAQGVRDIVAGRPWWSGKPTDIAIREGFRTPGEKPNLGTVNMPKVSIGSEFGAPTGLQAPETPTSLPDFKRGFKGRTTEFGAPTGLQAPETPIRLPDTRLKKMLKPWEQ